jgi:hypothetical protein
MFVFSEQSSKHNFVKCHSVSTHKYSEAEIKKMLVFLKDNIFRVIGDQIPRQYVGIPIDMNCAPLLADLSLYSYEVNLVLNYFYR